MVYLINQTILFNEGEGSLAWHDRENEKISLSAPLSRILATLVDNPGVTMSRESLLRETLEKHALSPSMNNLNNYISLLRKVLREFNLADAIVTIPKTGIIFTADSIEVLASKAEKVTPDAGERPGDESVQASGIPSTPPVPPRGGVMPARRRYPIKALLAVGVMVLLILFTAVFPSRFPYRSLVKVDVPGKCRVYALQDPVDREVLAGYQELCADNILFFISKKQPVLGTLMKKPRVLISCTKEGKGCVTYVDY